MCSLCRCIAGFAAAASLAACAPAAPAHQSASTALLPYPSQVGPITVGADSVTVLYRGVVAFPVVTRLIAHARARLDVEMYEIQRDDLVAALLDAAARGVKVTVITDPTVDASVVSGERLRAGGVDVVFYPVRKQMIDHVKLMVVDDGEVAITGGINWGAASALHHDVDLLISGPAAANLARIFHRDMVTAARPDHVPPERLDLAVRVAATLPTAEIRPSIRAAIDGASFSIDLQLYVLTDLGIVHALERAAARGVRIRILLDGTERPSDAAATELRSHGIPVRLYRGGGELLHAKTMVVDHRTVVAGSANWSGGGFARNHEVDLILDDAPAVAAVFLEAANFDWSASRVDADFSGAAAGDAEAA